MFRIDKTDNFIGIFENLYDDQECHSFLDYFEKCKDLGLTFSRQDADDMEEHQKNDESISIDTMINLNPGSFIIQTFTNKFWKNVYDPYVQTYSVLKFTGQFGIRSMKLQKTLPGQGYHIWHFEDGSMQNLSRRLTFITYLNDVEDGGETEFLYLGKRIKPTKGTTLLFPTGYTHTHRGNPPLSGEKYIITGWLDLFGR